MLENSTDGLKYGNEKMPKLPGNKPPEQGGENECRFAKVSLHGLQPQIYS
jgi:hypothetical protein